MDPALLEKLRENSGLRLDKEGRFWHRGGAIEHARTLAVLHRGIHRAADGRWPTLSVNVLGSFAMGLLVGWLVQFASGSEDLRLLIGVGLLGGFTTFSSFALEFAVLVQRGAIGSALAYVALSLVAGFAGLFLGLMLMRSAL